MSLFNPDFAIGLFFMDEISKQFSFFLAAPSAPLRTLRETFQLQNLGLNLIEK